METQITYLEIPAPAERATLNIETLVAGLLGFEAASLASMSRAKDAANETTRYGVQTFMRRVLEHAIQLREYPDLVIRLKNEDTARAASRAPSLE